MRRTTKEGKKAGRGVRYKKWKEGFLRISVIRPPVILTPILVRCTSQTVQPTIDVPLRDLRPRVELD